MIEVSGLSRQVVVDDSCLSRQVLLYTVEPVLKHCPIGHKNVIFQARWSLVTGSFTLKYRNIWSFKIHDSGLATRRVSLYIYPMFCVVIAGLLTTVIRDYQPIPPVPHFDHFSGTGKSSDRETARLRKELEKLQMENASLRERNVNMAETAPIDLDVKDESKLKSSLIRSQRDVVSKTLQCITSLFLTV